MSHVRQPGAQRARRLLALAGPGLLLLAMAACSSSAVPQYGMQSKAGVAGRVAAEADPKHNTEAYDHIIDNPFQLVAQAPLSTFSSDVDTASYSNVRRFLLTERKLPPKDAVRVEELVNYFTYDYPAPKDGRPVAIAPELIACPWNAKHRLLRIGVQSVRLTPGQMPPRNFVFLVDTSGSMNATNRLQLLRQSLELLAETLTGEDRVSIVAYAGAAGLVLPPTAGDRIDHIKAALHRLHAGGSTNGGQGIELAYRVAQEAFIPGGVNRVILGTDGDFNVGVTNAGDLIRLIEEKRKTGVYLTVLGFGMGNLKDATIEKLAHHGNGHYAYIDSEREARKLFVEQGAALVTVAKDVKFQVEFNPARVSAYRLIGYENRLLKAEDFNNDQKDAGDLGSGHTVTALYELVPAGEKLELPGVDPLKYQQPAKPSAAAATGEWLTIKLRYKDPEAEQSQLFSVPVTDAEFRAEPSADCRFAAAVAAFGMLLRDSPYKGSATYADVARTAGAALGGDPLRHRAEFLSLVQSAAELSR